MTWLAATYAFVGVVFLLIGVAFIDALEQRYPDDDLYEDEVQ